MGRFRRVLSGCIRGRSCFGDLLFQFRDAGLPLEVSDLFLESVLEVV
jgi:hypothetical protein